MTTLIPALLVGLAFAHRADGAALAPQLVKDEVPDDTQISGEPLSGAKGLQTNHRGWPGFRSEGGVFASFLYLRVSL